MPTERSIRNRYTTLNLHDYRLNSICSIQLYFFLTFLTVKTVISYNTSDLLTRVRVRTYFTRLI